MKRSDFGIPAMVFILLAISITSAHGQKSRKMPPDSVCRQFFYYFNNYQYDKARELATEKTKKIIDFVENLSRMGGGGKIVLNDKKKDLTGCEVRKRMAVCTYSLHGGGEQKVILLKQKGRWLVDLKNGNETPQTQ